MLKLTPGCMGHRVPDRTVQIVNTLGGALQHYSLELLETLEGAQVTTRIVSLTEPSVSGRSSLSWLLDYIRVLLEVRPLVKSSKSNRLFVTWPVLGFIDVVIVRLLFGRQSYVLVHDPKPLVRARGYGFVVQALAGLLGADSVLVHSAQAKQALRSRRLRSLAQLLPHPMRKPIPTPIPLDIAPVRVLGQFKPDRDLSALSRLASELPDRALEITGRRWPDVNGWTVKDEFVSEAELDRLIQTASVVLIPYKRFFQSGIAIRCLEYGIPVVGPRDSSLSDLLGEESPLLVRDSDWKRSVEFATSASGREAALQAAYSWHARAGRDWKNWIDG